MKMNGARIVTIFGASGFVGRHVVQELARQGWRIRAAVRRPHLAHFLRPMGMTGQIYPVQANLRHEASVRQAIAGADAVINLVGILFQSGAQSFDAIHVEGAETIARVCKEAGIGTLLHVSALGADPHALSLYAASKAVGEMAVRAHMPDAVIFRPSVIFGPEDRFFNFFAFLARLSPVIPLFGGGETRMQPVYVGDVAKAVAYALDEPRTRGKTYELGGAEIMSLADIWQLVLKATARKRFLVPVPFWLASLKAAFLGLLPRPLITRDQLRMLKTDNIVSAQAIAQGHTLEGLGITPNAPAALVSGYLVRFRPAGEFTQIEEGELSNS
jgi:NADH dehydrogenase